MCGIVGYYKLNPDKTIAGTEKYSLSHQSNTDLADVMETLGEFSNRRGEDNCGIMSLSSNKWQGIKGDEDILRLRTKKSAGKFNNFTSNIGWYSKKSVIEGQSTFIHTRKASSGGKNLDVAHPIMNHNITLIHNGTLASGWREHASNGAASDTTAIAELIVERGIKWTYETLEGPMTLIWHDCKDQSINVIHHGDRTLHRVEHSGYHFFASEGWMLNAAFDINGITLENQPELLPANTHYKYVNGTVTEVAVYTPKPKTRSANTSYNETYYGTGYSSPRTKKTSPAIIGSVVDHPTRKANTSMTDPVIPTSEVKMFHPIVCKPFQITEYGKCPEACCLTCIYDSESSIAPENDNLAVDVVIHGVPSKLAKNLLKLQVPILVKVVGGCQVVPAMHNNYSRGFLGDHRSIIPVFQYAGTLTEVSEEEGYSLIEDVQLMQESSSLISGIRYNLPGWDTRATAPEFLSSTLKYFELWHCKDEDYTWPFKYDDDSEQCIPTPIVGYRLPPTYEFHKKEIYH